MALVGKAFVLHGFSVGRRKEVSSWIGDHGGVVAFALGRNVCNKYSFSCPALVL